MIIFTINYSGCNFQYSVNGGTNFTVLGTFNLQNHWYYKNGIVALLGNAGWSSLYPNFTIAKTRLSSALSGQSNVRFRFFFASDATVSLEGIAIDSISIVFSPPVVHSTCNSSTNAVNVIVNEMIPEVENPISDQVATSGKSFSLSFTSTDVFRDNITNTLSITADLPSWLSMSIQPALVGSGPLVVYWFTLTCLNNIL